MDPDLAHRGLESEIRAASRSEHDDLFWALRGGGGGNFGVVTRFMFRLYGVGPEVFGGLIAWPFERSEESSMPIAGSPARRHPSSRPG